VRYKGESLLKHGDLSVLSFHATKVYNTFEGGAIICPDAKTKQRIDYLKNFGFADEVTVMAPGINGKMSEINAAFGLLQLKHIQAAITRRGEIDSVYREELATVSGITCLPVPVETERTFPYFPILVGDNYHLSRDGLYARLKEHNIHARRYFYPLISDMPMYRGIPSASQANLPVAEKLSQQVLCLPIYPDLKQAELELIVKCIKAGAT
jgi:dTDP-4-amino-4,6-dideoxygalactose transaminase